MSWGINLEGNKRMIYTYKKVINKIVTDIVLKHIKAIFYWLWINHKKESRWSSFSRSKVYLEHSSNLQKILIFKKITYTKLFNLIYLLFNCTDLLIDYIFQRDVWSRFEQWYSKQGYFPYTWSTEFYPWHPTNYQSIFRLKSYVLSQE